MLKKGVSALFVCVALGSAAAKAGGIPVIDASNLTQNMAQVTHMVTQINHMLMQIEQQLAMIRTIGGSHYADLGTSLLQQRSHLAQLLSSASALRYNLASIQSERDALFPTDWRKVDLKQLGARRQQWDNAVTEANHAAMQAQAAVQRIEARNRTIEALLAQSQTANGQVRQQQIGNQLSVALTEGVHDLNQSVMLTQRAMMAEQQREVAERELLRETHRRLMQGFTERGKPVNVPTALPSIR